MPQPMSHDVKAIGAKAVQIVSGRGLSEVEQVLNSDHRQRVWELMRIEGLPRFKKSPDVMAELLHLIVNDFGAVSVSSRFAGDYKGKLFHGLTYDVIRMLDRLVAEGWLYCPERPTAEKLHSGYAYYPTAKMVSCWPRRLKL